MKKKLSEEEIIELVTNHLDLDELLDLLSPTIEDVIEGLKDEIYEKQDKIINYLELDSEDDYDE